MAVAVERAMKRRMGRVSFMMLGLQWNCSGEIGVKNDLESRDRGEARPFEMPYMKLWGKVCFAFFAYRAGC
jgi:hypothetical protein